MPTITHRSVLKRAGTMLVMLLAALHLVSLDADPPPFLSASIVGDEGYWAHNARLETLFGKAFTDDFVEDVMVAPILFLLLRTSFSMFGVGFWQARLIPALFGVGSIVLMYKLLSSVNRRVAIVGTFLLSTSFLFFSINRLVMGESVSIFLLLLSAFLIQKKHVGASGIAFGLAVLSKANAIFLLPAFFLLLNLKAATLLPSFLVLSAATVGVTMFFIQQWTGIPFVTTYLSLSGTDYFPHQFADVVHNVKTFLLSPFWIQNATWLLLLATLISFPQVLPSFPGRFGMGIIASQILTIAPLSNQGSDHRFLFLFVGLVIVGATSRSKVTSILLGLFVVWNAILIGRYFFHSQYTLRDASRRLVTVSSPGEKLVGFFSHELVMENKLYPLYWAPRHEKFYRINQEIEDFRPEFVVSASSVDGFDGTIFTPEELLKLGTRQEAVQAIGVLPRDGKDQFSAEIRRVFWE